jgi:hypothetical protein
MKGVGLFLLSGAVDYLYYSAINEAERGNLNGLKVSSNQIPNLGGAETEVGVLLVATSGFIFTRVDDIVGSATAAREFNKLHEQDTDLSFQIQPRPDGVALALTRSF